MPFSWTAPSPQHSRRTTAPCELRENLALAPGYAHLILTNALGCSFEPGQFVMAACRERSDDPYLRRPISVLGGGPDYIELVVKDLGRGSALLTTQRPGVVLDCVGPLGNGFPLPPEGAHVILVGGGVGIPPLLFLAERLAEQRFTGRVTALIGGRSTPDLLLLPRFEAAVTRTMRATEDGSDGRRGRVTDLLADALDEPEAGGPVVVYSCGPTPMMKAAAAWTAPRRIPLFVSLEERMGCGTGLCVGCVTGTKTAGYQRVCTEGPVFLAYDVDGYPECEAKPW